MKSMAKRKCILVPVDFSPTTVPLIRYSRALADQLDATMVVLHVVQPFSVDWRMDMEPFHRQQRSAARQELNELLTTELKHRKHVSVELRSGHPVEEITKYAQVCGADLIVVGAHGHAGIAQVLLGSVGGRVAAQAPCPVLVFR